MKKIVLISVLLNLGLLGLLGYKFKNGSAPATPETKTHAALAGEEKISADEKSAPAEKPAPATAEKISAGKFSWRNVEAEEYKKYIANLRAIHCPEATIRDIIIADVTKFYASKLAPYR